jgi:hypothetical protein
MQPPDAPVGADSQERLLVEAYAELRQLVEYLARERPGIVGLRRLELRSDEALPGIAYQAHHEHVVAGVPLPGLLEL